jgi:hypothetical protein
MANYGGESVSMYSINYNKEILTALTTPTFYPGNQNCPRFLFAPKNNMEAKEKYN